MSAPIVRRAGPGDLAELARLIGAFRDFLGAPAPTDEALPAVLRAVEAGGASEFALGWLGCPDDRSPAAGYAQLAVLPSVWSAGHEAWLEDLYVDEPARGRGLADALIEHVFSRARARGATAIALNTNERNERAQAFYLRHGFRAAAEARWGGGREIRFVRRIEPALG